VFKRTLHLRSVSLGLGLCLALVLAGAASASAATLYVSNSSTVVVGGKSCAQPDFATIQAAIDAGGAEAKVAVCPGTYSEQLEITQPLKLSAANGAGSATVAMPAAAGNSDTACDTAEGGQQKDTISICTGGTVSISGLNVEAIVPVETCGGGLYGIFVGGGGTLAATNVLVNGASTSLNSFKGCQHGVAIEAGSALRGEVGHAILKKVTVFGYEKNGPTAVGSGSTLSMSASTVTGEGPSPYIAQNGVEVAYGASGTIKSTAIDANECSLAEVCSATSLEEQATGVLFYGAASGSSVSSSSLKENDLGGYYDSTSATQPAAPEVTFKKDVLTGNRYEGFVLEQGKALLSRDIVNGSGDVGIDLVQNDSQTLASQSSATGTTVEGQSEAGIKVESDNKPGDIKGSFVFAHGTLAGNGTPVKNESTSFEVVL